MLEHRRWVDLPPRARAGVVVGGGVQLGLLAAALADLRRRDAALVRGPRWVWALVSLLNFVGPIAYFTLGRRAR
ncbi:PLDc N-terminal domain-containing protein [Pseudonocardia sp. S2-4]|uniref:PLDc N-terminal domain-containing protein n=1 Tax=Pseudonocardia humida TaxID=2800819 RepID=A0ABT1AB45_9PSEU|nr:PLDc N-terminal domain-containing protein [Pseudonocardia humida]